MRTIKASELGTFVYCQRAWWYQQNDVEPANQHELLAGSDDHREHAVKVASINVLRLTGWFLLLAALVLLAMLLTKLVL